MLSFDLTDEQKAIRELARDFAQQEIVPVAAEHDEKGKWPAELVQKAFEVGLMNVAIPTDCGGPGLGVLDECLIMEELAAGCIGITLNFQVSNLAATPIKIAGTPEQKKKFLEPLANEPLLASYAVTEPGAGSDVAGMKMRAEKKGDEYVLNGTKCWITGGGHATFFTVFCYTDPEAGHDGMSAFVVPRDTEGVSVGKKENMMGQRASDTRQIMFEDAVVPASHRIGSEGGGFKLAMATFNQTRPPVAAGAIGLSKSARDHALRYAQERKAFGQPIAGFQGIQFMLANMERDIQAGRLLTYRAAWLADQGRSNVIESSCAKLFSADAAMRITTDAVQIFGGNGYSKEYPVEKLMRDAKILQIYEGTSQIQRLIIARQMLKR